MSTRRQYKYESPYEWLAEAAQGWSKEVLYHELLALAATVDGDTLQDLFQKDMADDGYFEESES